MTPSSVCGAMYCRDIMGQAGYRGMPAVSNKPSKKVFSGPIAEQQHLRGGAVGITAETPPERKARGWGLRPPYTTYNTASRTILAHTSRKSPHKPFAAYLHYVTPVTGHAVSVCSCHCEWSCMHIARISMAAFTLHMNASCRSCVSLPTISKLAHFVQLFRGCHVIVSPYGGSFINDALPANAQQKSSWHAQTNPMPIAVTVCPFFVTLQQRQHHMVDLVVRGCIHLLHAFATTCTPERLRGLAQPSKLRDSVVWHNRHIL